MQFIDILAFYQKNGLYHSNYDYEDKIVHLDFFNQFDRITIDAITDYCTYRSLTVKNATINREISVARAAYNFYNKHHDDNLKNPFNGYKLFEADFIPRYLTSKESKKLLDATMTYNNRLLYAFVFLALNTGSRASELTKLEWENVHLEQGFFIVRNSLSKNKRTVYKPLNAKSIQVFSTLQTHPRWVFYNQNTDKNIRSFRRGFLLATQRAKIGKVRIHDLRHTFASFLVSKGVPIYNVMQLLGHSSIQTTKKYSHLSPNNLSDSLKHLPDL